MQTITHVIDLILANPGRAIGIAGACILAVLETLVGKGVLTPDNLQTAQNIGAFIVILMTTFFPTWGPIQVAAQRHSKAWRW